MTDYARRRLALLFTTIGAIGYSLLFTNIDPESLATAYLFYTALILLIVGGALFGADINKKDQP